MHCALCLPSLLSLPLSPFSSAAIDDHLNGAFRSRAFKPACDIAERDLLRDEGAHIEGSEPSPLGIAKPRERPFDGPAPAALHPHLVDHQRREIHPPVQPCSARALLSSIVSGGKGREGRRGREGEGGKGGKGVR